MRAWFNDPRELFKADEVMNFWPNSKQTIEERVNASSRFIIYASSILYLIRRDIRILVLAGMVLSVIYIIYRGGLIKDYSSRPIISTLYNNDVQVCQKPTADNPMANVLISDIGDRPDRPPACFYPSVRDDVKRLLDDTIPYDCGRSRCALPKFQRNAAARQFVTGPVTTVPGDQTGFAECLYGKKFQPLCRDDPTRCDPNARGAQLEAFAGLDVAGDKRSGMFAK